MAWWLDIINQKCRTGINRSVTEEAEGTGSSETSYQEAARIWLATRNTVKQSS